MMRIEIYADSQGQFRWRLVAANGNVVADSGEGYSTKSNAVRAARRFRWSTMFAKIVHV